MSFFHFKSAAALLIASFCWPAGRKPAAELPSLPLPHPENGWTVNGFLNIIFWR
jgi:hypothetical protein